MANNNQLNFVRSLSIGLDPFFDILESSIVTPGNQEAFPPFDICKLTPTTYLIEVALAGYEKDDLSITIKDGTISIEGKKKASKFDKLQQEALNKFREKGFSQNSEELFPTKIHNGISSRYFTKNFILAEDVEVTSASYVNGLLSIELERKIPEKKKVKTIGIN